MPLRMRVTRAALFSQAQTYYIYGMNQTLAWIIKYLPAATIIPILAMLGTGFAYVRSEFKDSEKKWESCRTETEGIKIKLIMLQNERDSGFPEWTKDADGRWTYANGEFVRFFLAPSRREFHDIQGKTNAEITFFSPGLRLILDSMDREVIIKGYSCRSRVEFNKVSPCFMVFKKLTTIPGSPIIFYKGIACPII